MPQPCVLLAHALILVSLGAVLAPEALAAGEKPALRQPSNPWAAAGLSGLAMPVTAIGASGLAGLIPGGGGTPLLGILLIAPALTGTGQWYAGDWQRGLFVGLGGEAVVLGTAFGVSLAAKPGDSGVGILIALAGITAGTLYSVWAGFDAYQTSQRLSKGPLSP